MEIRRDDILHESMPKDPQNQPRHIPIIRPSPSPYLRQAHHRPLHLPILVERPSLVLHRRLPLRPEIQSFGRGTRRHGEAGENEDGLDTEAVEGSEVILDAVNQCERKTTGGCDEGLARIWVGEEDFDVMRGIDAEACVGEGGQRGCGKEFPLAEVDWDQRSHKNQGLPSKLRIPMVVMALPRSGKGDVDPQKTARRVLLDAESFRQVDKRGEEALLISTTTCYTRNRRNMCVHIYACIGRYIKATNSLDTWT